MKTVLALIVLLAGCASRDVPAWQTALEEGRAAAEAGDHARATACLRRAGDTATGAEAAACRAQLAIVLAAAGDAAGAEAAWRQAIDGFAASLSADAPELAASCDALARLVASRGRMAEAETLLRRALASRSAGPEAAYRQAMLADAVRSQNRPAEAAPLYRQAVTAWEQRPGEATNLALTLHGLAQCVAPAEARGLLERALRLLDGTPDADAVRAPILDTLGTACAMLGDLPAAEAALARALRIVETTSPAAAPGLCGRLAALEQAAGSPRAVSRWREAIAGWETAHGTDSPELATSLFGLADTLDSIGRSAEAVAPAERALRLLERGGTDRQIYVAALNRLIGLCVHAGDLPRAIALNDTACQIVERTLGPKDPNLATALRNGAELQRRAGNAEAAAALERRTATVGSGR